MDGTGRRRIGGGGHLKVAVEKLIHINDSGFNILGRERERERSKRERER